MSYQKGRIYLEADGVKYYAITPSLIVESLTKQGIPVNWFEGKANGFVSRREGGSVGHILLKRSDLDAIDTSLATHSLTFLSHTNSVTISNLHIASAVAISGTQNRGASDIYLVELRDRRAHAKLTSIVRGYNIRTPDWVASNTFITSSTNGGTPWTWATMVADIWTAITAIGGALTTTLADWPTYDPENFCFFGVSALDALEHICEVTDHHLIVKRDGTFHIVSKGNADTANSTLATSKLTQALNPSWPINNDKVSVPETVRVCFPKRNPAFQSSTDQAINNATEKFNSDPVYYVDVNVPGLLPAVTGTITGAVYTIHDTMTAKYDELGSIQNSIQLAAQAQKRTTEYVQGLLGSNDTRNDLYDGAVAFEVGPRFSSVHWYDFGNGVRTQGFNDVSFPKRMGGSDIPSTVTEWPGIPDLSRWHLPYTRIIVGEVYNADIAANTSGIVRVQYGTQSSATVTTWADTALPHEIRAFEIFGKIYAVGERVICGYHRQTSRWVIMNSKGGDIVHFELEATLTLSGSAQAALLSLNAGSWVDSGTNIEVCDWYNTEGMWAGISGYRGIAVARGDQVSGRDAYDIIWMEQIAQVIQFTSTERIGATTAGQMAVTVNWYDHQGKEPVGSVIVRDPQGQFPDVHSGAKGTAVYDFHNGYYRIVSCQRIALFASATLTSDTCADSTPGISTFATMSTGDYIGAPGTTPTTASNPCGLSGIAGDDVLLRRTTNGNPNPSWEIIQVQHHSLTVVSDIRVDGLTLQYKTLTVYIQKCSSAALSWTTWHTGGVCP